MMDVYILMEVHMADKARHIVRKVRPDSIAEELNIEPGDEILEINETPIEDIFDYQYLVENEYIEVLVKKAGNGGEWLLEIEKDEDEDLGVEFENGLMDDYRSCHNKCVFCFIDQMPKGMRETLYFKDDDSRLSFLQGNYVTLTNMSDKDIERIIRYNMSPINISVQTTNPELRRVMLHNRFAGDVFDKIQRLADAGIELNGQVVLCKGLNDRDELDRTISDLEKYLPSMKSVSVVPVGLTKYRDGLFPLEPFDKEDAEYLVDQIGRWQDYYIKRHGVHFIHASDEWYLLADRPMPEEECYDGYLQLENGVGMMRLLWNEVCESLAELEGDGRKRRMTLATGKLAAPWLTQIVEKIREFFPNIYVDVIAIRNDFFGEKITVSGLITGQDLIAQLKGRDLGLKVMIPCNMLRYGENVFLDDLTVADAEKALNTVIDVVDSDGASLVAAILEDDFNKEQKRRQMYEQTDSGDSRQA